jgi:Fur family ferric uptake transcriptional regulator
MKKNKKTEERNKIEKKKVKKSVFADNSVKHTIGREVILNVLLDSEEHLSADEIYVKIHRKNPNIGLTTVYRTLELLEEKGIINKFYFKDKRLRYEMSDKYKDSSHHHHLVCTKCGKIFEYTDMIKEETDIIQKMEKILTKNFNFKIQNHLLQFYGTCSKCS